MKKIILFSLVLVATLLTNSCTKEVPKPIIEITKIESVKDSTIVHIQCNNINDHTFIKKTSLKLYSEEMNHIVVKNLNYFSNKIATNERLIPNQVYEVYAGTSVFNRNMYDDSYEPQTYYTSPIPDNPEMPYPLAENCIKNHNENIYHFINEINVSEFSDNNTITVKTDDARINLTFKVSKELYPGIYNATSNSSSTIKFYIGVKLRYKVGSSSLILYDLINESGNPNPKIYIEDLKESNQFRISFYNLIFYKFSYGIKHRFTGSVTIDKEIILDEEN